MVPMRDEEGQLLLAHGHAIDIGRQQAVKGTVEEAGAEAADHAERRRLEQARDGQMHMLGDDRVADLGEAQRDHGAGQADGAEREQDDAGRVVDVEQQRRDAGGAPAHRGIDREDPAAGVVGGFVVEPGSG